MRTHQYASDTGSFAIIFMIWPIGLWPNRWTVWKCGFLQGKQQ